MSGRRVLMAAFTAAVLAGGGLAAFALKDGGDERSVRSAETQEPNTTNTPSPTSESSLPIRFVLAESYPAGKTIHVAIENVGTRSYVFQSHYQACFLSYFDSSGRKFIIPPGTHCDLLAEETIKPGERKKLFTWGLDECVKDEWGCLESRPLSPGTYTIRGRFKPRAGGKRFGSRRRPRSST